MQPDHESDELQALLKEEYGAPPPLEKQFSANLIARLQAEASSLPSPSSTPARPNRSLLVICLGFAAIAASVLVTIWILNGGIPEKNREVAHEAKINSGKSAHVDLDTLSTFSAESESEHARLDSLSDRPRTMSLSESLSQSKHSSESRTPRNENLAAEERAPTALSQATLSLHATIQKEWPNVTVAAALVDRLYIVDGGRLCEVNTHDGSRRSVGNDDWQNTSAMGAASEHLYLVCDHQLYEVNPQSGARRSLGQPNWFDTKAILTVGDKLYIASNGQLYRVDPNDGSHEVLQSKTETLNRSPQPKQ